MTEDLTSETMIEILELIYCERKVMAIKRYRELRGVSLHEAKQFIEKLTDELKETSPEKFVKRAKSGCAGALLLIAALLCCALTGFC